MKQSSQILRSLVIASGNQGKVTEFKAFLRSHPFNIQSISKALEVNENGKTFLANAALKALAAAKLYGEWSLADDSGLCVEALNGSPGVHSARYAFNDEQRISRLLKELEGVDVRRASFCSAICIASPEEKILFQVEAKCEGLIPLKPRGLGGFGYDSVFEVQPIGLTFAEMTPDQKKLWGHRGIAFKKLEKQLVKYFAFEE